MDKNEIEILNRSIKQNGCLEQSLMAQEEAGELIQAINKFRRLGGIDSKNIYAPTGKNSTKYAFAYNDLCGEVADMEIMLHQMRSMLNGEQIDLIKSRKILRLETRLNINLAKNGK